MVQDEARAFLAQPRHGVEALRDQDFRQVGVGAKAREPEEDVEKETRRLEYERLRVEFGG